MALEPVANNVKIVNKQVKNTVNHISNAANTVAGTINTITGEVSNVINPLTSGLAKSINNITSNISGVAREGFQGLNVISDTLRDVNKNLTNIIPSKISKLLSESVKDVIDSDVYKSSLSTFSNVRDAVGDTFGFVRDGISAGAELFNVGREIFGELNNIRKVFTNSITQPIKNVRNLFDTNIRNPLSLGYKVLRDVGITVRGTIRNVEEIKRELDNLNIKRIKRDINREFSRNFREPIDDIKIGINDVRNNRNKILNQLDGKVDRDIFNEIQRQLDGIVETAEGIDQNDLERRISNFENYVNNNIDGKLAQELTDRIVVNGYDPTLGDIYIDERTIDLLDDYRNTKTNLNDIRDLSDFLTEKYGCKLGGERITDDVINASNFSADQNFYNNLVKYLLDRKLYRHLDCILRGGDKKYNNKSLHNVLSNSIKEVTNSVKDSVKDVMDAATLRVVLENNNNVVYDKKVLTLKLLS